MQIGDLEGELEKYDSWNSRADKLIENLEKMVNAPDFVQDLNETERLR